MLEPGQLLVNAFHTTKKWGLIQHLLYKISIKQINQRNSTYLEIFKTLNEPFFMITSANVLHTSEDNFLKTGCK